MMLARLLFILSLVSSFLSGCTTQDAATAAMEATRFSAAIARLSDPLVQERVLRSLEKIQLDEFEARACEEARDEIQYFQLAVAELGTEFSPQEILLLYEDSKVYYEQCKAVVLPHVTSLTALERVRLRQWDTDIRTLDELLVEALTAGQAADGGAGQRIVQDIITLLPILIQSLALIL